MDYRKFGKRIVLRIDRGEEVMAVLTALCKIDKYENKLANIRRRFRAKCKRFNVYFLSILH